VKQGETLFTLYSPALYAAEQEYLIARQDHDAAHAELLLHAAETKLRLWGLGEDQLRLIADKGEPIEKIPFKSPASGVVIEKNVIDGDAVMAGQRLFKIADLDQIWVEADVYEADLARITKHLPATISLTYLPGRTFEGKVAFVYPYLDPASRTGRVRIALANKGLELKPDMFATVTFKIALHLEQAKAKLKLVVPVTLMIVFLLLYINTRSLVETGIVLMAVPFPSSVPSGWSSCSTTTSVSRSGSG